MKKIFLSDQYQEDFKEKGYVRVPLLSDNEVNYLLEEIKKLKPDDDFNPDGNGDIPSTLHFSILDSNIEYKRKVQNLVREMLMPHINRVILEYRMLFGQLAIKPPGSGFLYPHQNYQHVKDINETCIAVYCPLVDTNETNGAFHLVEGSHKIFPNVFAPTVPPYCLNFIGEVMTKYSKPIYLKAGESLFFDDTLLHWSPTNNSAKDRPAVVVQCIPDKCSGTMFYFDKNMAEKGFEVFEVDTDFFVEHTPRDILNRPTFLKSLGFVDNKNRLLTEGEFVELLEKANKIRKKDYSPENNKSFFNVLKEGKFLKKFFRV